MPLPSSDNGLRVGERAGAFASYFFMCNMKVIRNILLPLALMMTGGVAWADGFVPVRFGVSHTEAMDSLAKLWGVPEQTTVQSAIYINKVYRGIAFDRIVVGFEDEARGGYFNQIRFFVARHVRRQAVAVRDSLARVLSTEYGQGITHDYEENGNKFYKGGTSPEGIGFLFTIYTQRRQGQWMTELRYGAFHKLKPIR